VNGLSVEKVAKSFGGLRAVAGVSFSIAPGELVGLVGPNGSGKTTLLSLVSGHESPGEGRVLLDGQPLAGLSPDRIARRGLLRMFQLTRLAGRALGLPPGEALARAQTVLEELSLTRVRDLDAGQLSGGQQKLLEFGCCFICPPRVALLDEPFAAVHPTLKEIMAGSIRARHREGQAFLIVSHDMPVIAELCPRTVCMNAGAVIADGPTRAVLSDPGVIEAYLGGEGA
jgi:ABC-type branched-subunit amino acid transport system ATPase component